MLLVSMAVALTVLAGNPASVQFTTLNPSTRPGQRRSTGMAEQQVGGGANLWVFGGHVATGVSNELFKYDSASANWVSLNDTGVPSGRERHGLAFDEVNQRLVAFGGLILSGFQYSAIAEVQVFNPATNAWTLFPAQGAAPAARTDPLLAWVPSASKFLMFGGVAGATSNTRFNDLWWLELNLSTGRAVWTQITAGGTAPSARNAACGGLDVARNRLVLFGGEGTGASALGGTFQYDITANAWEADAPTGAIPSNRSFADCGFDAANGVLVLYGGYDSNNTLAGTYTYDPVTKVWASYTAAGNPGILSDSGAAYSSVLGGILIFGGQAAVGTYVNGTYLVTLTPGGANQPPVANAGAAQTVPEQAAVTLDGSGSLDPEGQPLTYQWAQSAGPAVTLSSSTAQQPTFTAPTVTQPTTLSFGLVVNDGVQPSVAATVNVTVQDSVNEPPVADAGPDQSVAPGAQVTLTGAASSDPNNEPLTFAWLRTAGPAVTLVGANTATPQFTAPSTLGGTSLSFQLTVTDARGATSSDTVAVSVSADQAPVANAGVAQTAAEQAQVTLDGSGSSDPEGQPLTYQWTQSSGPAVTLSSATAQQPSFASPTVTQPVTLTFQLVVDDGLQSSAPATASVIVQDTVNEPPVASAGPDQSVAAGAQVTLTGAASSDPNNETLSYAWSQLSGAPVVLAASGSLATFSAPAIDGGLAFRLTVTDARGGTSSDEVAITVVTSVNGPPKAVATVEPRSGAAPLPVGFDGTQSSATLGRTLTGWRWEPGDGAPPLLGATAAHTYALPGGYNVLLTVTDDAGDSDTAKVQVSASENGVLPPDGRIVASAQSGDAPLPVQLSCACSDPQGRQLSYFWDFGDGALSWNRDPAHTFANPGTFQVRLWVSNGALTTSDRVSVRVGGVTPSPPVAHLYASPPAGPAPLRVSFVPVAQADIGSTLVSSTVTLHDGTVLTGAEPSFTYAQPGRYLALLTVTDSAGRSANDSVEVLVLGSDGVAPPKIVSRGASHARVGDAYQYDADGRVEAMGTGRVVFSLGGPAGEGVPPGASIDSETGALSWTPDRAGPVQLVIRAQGDRSESSDYQRIEIEVEAIDPRLLAVGCGCDAGGTSGSWLLGLLALAWAWAVRRRWQGT